MILLSFDIEEFDMPLEYNGTISFEKQVQTSRNGLEKILNLLEKHNLKATFFATVVFAEACKDLIEKLISQGHELASHTWYHSKFEIDDLRKSRERLSEVFNVNVTGLRMPRMKEVEAKEVCKAGYLYNSSVNPTFLPGRYNNWHVSRTYFREDGILQVPASVSPLFRIPLFWLSFHNFPFSIYKHLVFRTHKKDGYLNVYFHPWEFADIKNPDFKLPNFTTKDSGEAMVEKFDKMLKWMKNSNMEFSTFSEFRKSIEK